MARLFDDAQSQYLRRAGAVISGVPFAMGCWINLDDEISTVVMSQDNSSTEFYILKISANLPGNYVKAGVYSGTWRIATTTTGVIIGNWHYICGIFASNSDRRALIDGGSKGVNTDLETVGTVNQTVIGSYKNRSSAFMSGKIAEVSIWNLSVWPGATNSDKADAFEKILPSLAKAYSPKLYSLGLKSHWKLIRDEDIDEVGGYNLESYNSPTIGSHPRIIVPLSALKPIPTNEVSFAGSLIAQSEISAKLTKFDTQLVGNLTAQFGTSGSLTKPIQKLAGFSAGQSTVIGILAEQIIYLQGSLTTQSGISGNLKEWNYLQGVIAAQLNVLDAKLTRFDTQLVGNLAAQFEASGNLKEWNYLQGVIAVQSNVQGDLFVELATKTLFWRPESKIKETLEWKTEILRSHKGIEQRIKLRQIPRQIFKLQLILDTAKINSWFDSILHTWQKKPWKIPIWTEYTIHTEDINKYDTTIYLDTKFADYRNNSYAIIWKSSSEYEVILINTKTTSQLNLKFSVKHTFTGIKYIMPCRIAYVVSTNSRQKYNSPVSIIETIFAVYDNVNISGYIPEMSYDGLNVLILPSYMDEIHREESDGQIEINDFQTGIFRVRSDKEYNLLFQNHLFFNDTKKTCWEFRQFLHSLNGKQKIVLIPTFRNDLNLTDSVAPSDENFYVENIKLTINMGYNTLRTYVGFYFSDGTLLIRKITAIEEINETKEKITINESLGRNATIENCKICFVDKCRLASDRVDISWPFAHRNECKTNFMRVS